MTIVFEDSLIDWLAAEGYRPEYGARELKRQIRSLVETRLARAMLGGEVAQGDTVRIELEGRPDDAERAAPARDESGHETPETGKAETRRPHAKPMGRGGASRPRHRP